MTQPLWITESQVVELLSLREAITALEDALRGEAAGAASMDKTMLQYGTSNLHALGGKLGSLVGTKTWAHTEGGTCPLLLLWDAENGQLQAVIEAFALGSMRTGGISGVATDWMARPDSRVLAVAGTGKQALSQIAAVLAVRPIEDVRVWSPKADSRDVFARKVKSELGVDARPCASMREACHGADVVTLVTRAREPFIDAELLTSGCHLNAVGAIGPDREEFSQDIFARAQVVAVDTVGSARTLSREFMTRYAQGGWESVRPLSQLIASNVRRPEQADLSLFKAMGMGLSDLALGSEVLRRARTSGVGQSLANPVKAKPRLVVGPATFP